MGNSINAISNAELLYSVRKNATAASAKLRQFAPTTKPTQTSGLGTREMESTRQLLEQFKSAVDQIKTFRTEANGFIDTLRGKKSNQNVDKKTGEPLSDDVKNNVKNDLKTTVFDLLSAGKEKSTEILANIYENLPDETKDKIKMALDLGKDKAAKEITTILVAYLNKLPYVGPVAAAGSNVIEAAVAKALDLAADKIDNIIKKPIDEKTTNDVSQKTNDNLAELTKTDTAKPAEEEFVDYIDVTEDFKNEKIDKDKDKNV